MDAVATESGPPPVSVGGIAIPEAEIAREMQHHRADDPHEARAAAARALVVRELLRLEAERLRLAAEVEPAAGETLDEACVRVLLDREITVERPGEEECRRWYDQNRERLHRPDRVLLRHILLAAAPGDVEARIAARELGEVLIAELQAVPGRFDELAQRHSACPSREAGGSLGWIERGETTPEFERQVLRLGPGLARLTVESRWGHHVVHVDAVERGEPLDYPEAMPRIAAYLEAQSRQHAIHRYLRDLAGRHAVQGIELPAVQA